MRVVWEEFIQAYINPFICHFPLMLWSGDFVAKGEKGYCVPLQEEGTSVYIRFTPSSGFRVAGSSLIVFWAVVLFLTIVAKGIIVSLPCILPYAEIIDRPSY